MRTLPFRGVEAVCSLWDDDGEGVRRLLKNGEEYAVVDCGSPSDKIQRSECCGANLRVSSPHPPKKADASTLLSTLRAALWGWWYGGGCETAVKPFGEMFRSFGCIVPKFRSETSGVSDALFRSPGRRLPGRGVWKSLNLIRRLPEFRSETSGGLSGIHLESVVDHHGHDEHNHLFAFVVVGRHNDACA